MSDISSQVHPSAASIQADTPAGAVGRAPAHAAPRPRVWPAAVVVALQWAVIETPHWVEMQGFMKFMVLLLAPVAASLLLAVWWLFFSRLRWRDRLLGLGVAVAGGVASALLAPYPYMAFLMLALPWATTVWALYMLGTFFLPWPVRRAGLAAAFLLTWACFPLIRLEGIDGNFNASWVWRWSPTAEDRLMARLPARAKPTGAVALTLHDDDWPGFRGPHRDGSRPGVRIATDWTEHPPRQVWSHLIGPGWGSFAAVGDHLYTQEQRRQDEMVVCYNADNGEEIWEHKDPSRFEEDLAKAGPRATPTFHDGRVYTLGGRGLLTCLDAATGELKWQHDVAADSGAKVPQWGFSASPLVMKGVVTVFAGGPGGKGVLGYDASSGDLLWSKGDGTLGYSSPQPARLDGADQVLMATDVGLTAFDPTQGDVVWQHDWSLPGIGRIIQPAVLDESDVVVGGQSGTRRVRVTRNGDAWNTDEAWTSPAIQPFFYDQVVYQGHAYGFKDAILLCANLEDGGVKWRQRNDVGGQILLLSDQGLLLILWEQGAASVAQATPEGYKELGRFQAIKGKTWNHPVVAHGRLFVRNGEEAACYQLTEEK